MKSIFSWIVCLCTFSLKVLHSCAVSSNTLSCPRATLRSLVQRCHTVVMERLMVALLASLPTSSSWAACSSKPLSFSWKPFTSDTRDWKDEEMVNKIQNVHIFCMEHSFVLVSHTRWLHSLSSASWLVAAFAVENSVSFFSASFISSMTVCLASWYEFHWVTQLRKTENVKAWNATICSNTKW